MIISVDYDNTYTAAPELFTQLIKLFQDAGHTVICVTGRGTDMSQPVLDSIGKLVPCIFAGGEWKRTAAEQAGYKVNIWIDDDPSYIMKQTLLFQKK
jgi:hydroxymethylpyrimidine pyrophosphatase-like HAD family hydrolase